MGLRDAERGQAIQVGAVLLFAVLIIAFSSYQAVIIPADNRRVEFNHNQEVQGQLADLRNAMLSMPGSTSARSVTVALGTQYPSRTLGLNPTSPGGSLRTVGANEAAVNLTIDNAVAEGETGDYWDGDPQPYPTGAIEYSPIYNRYDEAPTTTFEHSVLYNAFQGGNTLVLANQTLVDGDRLSIVTLDGSLDRTSSRPTSVDVRPISSSTQTVRVEANSTDEPITLTFASRLTAQRWERILSDEDVMVSSAGTVAGGDLNEIRVELGRDNYTLRMSKAAVGQGATETDDAYLTDVAGGSGTVAQGASHDVTLAVRDRFNNPVPNVDVASSIGNGPKTTNADGEVTFTFDATGVNPGIHRLNFTTGDASPISSSTFDNETTENVTTTVDATTGGTNGGGAYEVTWEPPTDHGDNPDAAFDDCDDEQCTWDVGASGDDTLALNASLFPAFEGIDLEFAVTDQSVASLADGEGTTGSNGGAIETLTANANGTVDVLASANEGSDRITVEIRNVDGGEDPPGPPTTRNGIRYDGGLGTTGSNSGVQFDIENVDTSYARINAIKIHAQGTDRQYLYNADGREIEVSGGQPTGYAPDQGSAQQAYTTNNSTIQFTQNAVLTNSGSQQRATVTIRDFGSKPNENADSFTEYDFANLQRVAGSQQWDVAITLQFQSRGDVVYFFREG